MERSLTSDSPQERNALAFAVKGWRVFPLFEPTPTGCSCSRGDLCPISDRGKHPRIRGGPAAATTDAEKIQGWWRRWPRANVGLLTGEKLTVLDVDPRNGGGASMLALPVLPVSTPFVETGGLGLHVYFAPDPRVTGDAVGLWPGIDVKDAGYVVAPPSVHHSGRRYATCTSMALPLAPQPEWLVAKRLERKPEAKAVPAVVPVVTGTGAVARFRGYVAGKVRNTGVPAVDAGQGSAAWAIHLARCAKERGISASDALAVLWEAVSGHEGWTFEWVSEAVERYVGRV